jgi:DnaK suppressor protein
MAVKKGQTKVKKVSVSSQAVVKQKSKVIAIKKKVEAKSSSKKIIAKAKPSTKKLVSPVKGKSEVKSGPIKKAPLAKLSVPSKEKKTAVGKPTELKVAPKKAKIIKEVQSIEKQVKKVITKPAVTKKPELKKAIVANNIQGKKPVEDVKMKQLNKQNNVIKEAIKMPVPKPVKTQPVSPIKNKLTSATNDSKKKIAVAETQSESLKVLGIAPYASQEEDYMNEEMLSHFRNILMSYRMQLMEKVNNTVHHMQDDSANLPDLNDRATLEEEFGLELRTRDRERKLIKKIEESLMRINDGEYGYCEACGIEIGVRRLEARPTATLCIDCKTIEEIKEKQRA